MRVIKSFFIAFSIYSRIPVPQFDWKEEDMKYMLCFFPWIGGVIGILLFLWRRFSCHYGAGNVCDTMVGAAIPLLVTGGFHADGFMDTMDAFHSYQPRERKLEILKDSHIGAFSVIMLAVYGLVYLGAFSEVREESLFRIFCVGFFLSRCLSGICVVSLPSAKNEGMLSYFADSSERNAVKLALCLQALASAGYMLSQSVGSGCLALAAALLTLVYYTYRCRKELGGITGDTAGYFVLFCEMSILVSMAVMDIIG